MNEEIIIDGVKYLKEGANYHPQVTKVLSLLGDDMLKALTEADAIIAGGAVLSSFTNQEVNDVDVYFRSKGELVQAFLAVTKDWKSVYLSHTSKSITLSDPQTKTIVQFIYFDYFMDAQDIFKLFDFTVCMAAVELYPTAKLVLDSRFLGDVASRTLRFNKDTRYPYASLLRVKKYQERGYRIGKGNLLGIALACALLPIESWESAKEQLGGVYGDEIDLAVENNNEFNDSLLFEVVTAIREERSRKAPCYEDIFFELTGRQYGSN